jgi:hypothetical protein
MKLPAEYHDDILSYEESTYGPSKADGSPVIVQVYSLVFPPIGFFPFYGIGNGDYHGYYWPIGREDRPPIVAFSSHDAWSLIPEHSNIESLYRSHLAQSTDENETLSQYEELATRANGKPPAKHDVRGLKFDDFSQLLLIDPKSPFLLCAAADVHIANNEIEAAEQRYRESLDLLPEYVAAHFGLAYVLRRQRRGEEATIYLRQALMGPLVFYGGSFWADTALPGQFRNDWQRKALMWLQQSKFFHESVADDPFITRIGNLTFQTGLALNPDLDILQKLTEEYATIGRYADAANIWRMIADRASRETATFRERYDLNPSTYGTKLANLYELSGNMMRAKLVRNMVSIIDKPKGQYL